MLDYGRRASQLDAESESRNEAKRQFDELLKNSEYFRDVIQTVREGAGAAIGTVLADVFRDQPETAVKLLKALRDEAGDRTIRYTGGPSSRSSMELVLRAAADRLQEEMTAKKP